ncbi:hypothetical protein ACYA5A_21605 [Klebsiella pneumoniae]
MKLFALGFFFASFFAAASPWVYQDSKDEMRGTSTHIAVTESTNFKEFSFPYNGGAKLRILLVSNDDKTVSAAGLSLDKGQFVCSDRKECEISAKFDDGSIQEFAVIKTKNSENTLLIVDSSLFAETLRISKSAFIEVPVYQEGNQQFKFELEPAKFESNESGKPYVSQLWGLNLKEKINLEGKSLETNDRGLSCYRENLEVLKGWSIDAKICVYENLITFISFDYPYDIKKINSLVSDINKKIGSNVKFKNGGAAWLKSDGMKMGSIFLFGNKKDGINFTFSYDPPLSKIPPKK